MEIAPARSMWGAYPGPEEFRNRRWSLTQPRPASSLHHPAEAFWCKATGFEPASLRRSSRTGFEPVYDDCILSHATWAMEVIALPPVSFLTVMMTFVAFCGPEGTPVKLR